MSLSAGEMLEMAWNLRVRESYPQALDLLDQVEKQVPAHSPDLGRCFLVKAQVFADLGNVEQALQAYRSAEEVFRQLDQEPYLMHIYKHLAELHTRQGHYPEAARYFDLVLPWYRKQTPAPQLSYANVVRSYAVYLDKTDRKELARERWSEARALYKKLGIAEGVRECEEQLKGGSGK